VSGPGRLPRVRHHEPARRRRLGRTRPYRARPNPTGGCGMSGRPKLLDLFCCEGGASTGYTEAGFDVYGVDLFKHADAKGKVVGPSRGRYPFPSIEGDVIDVMGLLLSGEVVEFARPDGGSESL